MYKNHSPFDIQDKELHKKLLHRLTFVDLHNYWEILSLHIYDITVIHLVDMYRSLIFDTLTDATLKYDTYLYNISSYNVFLSSNRLNC